MNRLHQLSESNQSAMYESLHASAHKLMTMVLEMQTQVSSYLNGTFKNLYKLFNSSFLILLLELEKHRRMHQSSIGALFEAMGVDPFLLSLDNEHVFTYLNSTDDLPPGTYQI